jgi:putative membrane protein
MMQIKFAAALVAFAFAGSAMAQTPPPPPPAEAKMRAMPYVMAAGMSDQFEIQSSRIAMQKSPNAATRRYAAMLVQHHNRTTAATMRAATRARLAPPAPMLDPAAAPSIAELNAASRADFDRIYFGQQVPAHQAALDLHRGYAANGDAAPLRVTARTAVPVVRKHLTDAQRMMRGMRGHNMSRM